MDTPFGAEFFAAIAPPAFGCACGDRFNHLDVPYYPDSPKPELQGP